MLRVFTYLSLAVLLLLICSHPCLALQDDNAGRVKKSPGKAPGPSAGGGSTSTTPGRAPRTTGPRARGAASARAKSGAPASLTVSTQPESLILLDGQSRGFTDSAGNLSLRQLKPGSHALVVRKTNYQDVQRTISLIGGENQVQTITLTPLDGHLTITANIHGAVIEVNGMTFNDSVMNLSLAPGPYRINVSKPGYRTITRDINVNPGESPSFPIMLEPMSLDEMMAQAIERFGRGKFNETIEMAGSILAAHPDVPQAHYLLAYSYYRIGNYPESFPHFMKTISLNGKDVFSVRHRHNLAEMCSGTITLTKTTFAFQSESSFGHDFEVPYDKFKEFYVEAGSDGVLHTKVRIPKGAGRKGEDEKDYNFYVPEAITPLSIIGCRDCRQRMELVNQLMLWARKQASGRP